MGDHVSIQFRVVPLYSELIRFHNNIAVARNVDFCTHDIIHRVLNRLPENDYKLKEHIGCIEIMDNVFIGANSVILYGTKIGPNVIVASGSVVTKDCMPVRYMQAARREKSEASMIMLKGEQPEKKTM